MAEGEEQAHRVVRWRRTEPGSKSGVTVRSFGPAVVPYRLSAQGFTSRTPVASKSAMFPVTTVIPRTMAVAAIGASRSARGSGTCSRAHVSATAASTGKVRSSNSGRT